MTKMIDFSKFIVCDFEGNGFTPTKIHVMSIAYYKDNKLVVKSIQDYDTMRKILSHKDAVIVGHNLKMWDIPLVIENILGVKIKGFVIDTLWLSWYLFPELQLHGLNAWGKHYGIPKPPIDDWEDLSIEEYIHRCEEDVKINMKLWIDQFRYLKELYKTEERIFEFIDYLMFKGDCVAEQLNSRWKLHVERAMDTLEKFQEQFDEKYEQLKDIMPKKPVYRVKTKPSNQFKKDGTHTKAWTEWLELLSSNGLPEDHNEDVQYLHHYEEPNPNSSEQIKEWLFSLGWKPDYYVYSKGKNEEEPHAIPQIRTKDKELTSSVKALIKKNKDIEVLDGYTVLKHRSDILKGFLNNATPDGWLRADISGITNTLRLRHKILVNLPGVTHEGDPSDGEHIRGCLIAPEGYELCGSDMSSLEDRTKQHYMWEYDPEYVRTMMVDGFDPHLDLAESAKVMTSDDVSFYKIKSKERKEKPLSKEEQKRFDKLSQTRHEYKTANYSCTYGAGAATLSRSLGISESKAKKIINAYKDRNWAIQKISDNCKVVEVRGQKWLYNPVSTFWYSLRYDKDKFSTLNQGTGVFCFDTWIRFFRSKRPQLTGQFHDEVILTIREGHREECEALLKWAIRKTNEKLKLNRELDIDVQFGKNYAEIH